MKKTIPYILGLALFFGSNIAFADESKADGPADRSASESFARKTAPANIVNIAPYRREVLSRIAKNWHPGKKGCEMTVQIELNHEGKLLRTRVEKSSGSESEDKLATDAIKRTTFEPLPDWFKQDKLQLKIDLAKVEKEKK